MTSARGSGVLVSTLTLVRSGSLTRSVIDGGSGGGELRRGGGGGGGGGGRRSRGGSDALGAAFSPVISIPRSASTLSTRGGGLLRGSSIRGGGRRTGVSFSRRSSSGEVFF